MLKIGIVGCGGIFTMHATSVAQLDNAKIVGVCDIKKDRADLAASKYGCNAYYDYKDLIATEKPDVLHICVPHYMHPIITKYALLNGINVLCEKPMAIKLEDAVENVNLAKEKGLKYGVIFQCRYNNSARLVKENLDNGKLGKIISARVVLTWKRDDNYYANSDWKGTWEKEGGGVIIDQAIHSLDLANWFINDEVVSIKASLHNRGHKNFEVEDTGEGFIRYKNGATLGFWAMNNYGIDEPIEIRLYCTNGKAVLSYDDATVTFNDGTTLSTKTESDGVEYENGEDYFGFQHLRQIRDFYNSIESDTEPFISGEEALKIQRIICEIYKEGNFED